MLVDLTRLYSTNRLQRDKCRHEPGRHASRWACESRLTGSPDTLRPCGSPARTSEPRALFPAHAQPFQIGQPSWQMWPCGHVAVVSFWLGPPNPTRPYQKPTHGMCCPVCPGGLPGSRSDWSSARYAASQHARKTVAPDPSPSFSLFLPTPTPSLETIYPLCYVRNLHDAACIAKMTSRQSEVTQRERALRRKVIAHSAERWSFRL